MVSSAGLSTPTHAEDDSFLIPNFLNPQEPAGLSDPSQGWSLLILYLIQYDNRNELRPSELYRMQADVHSLAELESRNVIT